MAASVDSRAMPRGYEEGPVAEAAQARLDALERGESLEARRPPAERVAVYGSTEDEPEPHFLGWADEVDADDLFESGHAWGISLRRRVVKD
jgi:hypothetical protein